MTQCPSRTGIPQDGIRCPVSGREHHCMRPAYTHPVHTCHCGNHWICSTTHADQLTRPADMLTWVDPDTGTIWVAPIGSPPPAYPMPAAWVITRRGPSL